MHKPLKISFFLLFFCFFSFVFFATKAQAAVTVCDTDINQDTKVNVLDWNIFATDWANNTITNPRSDINKDQKINIFDASEMFRNWGKICSAAATATPIVSATITTSVCNKSCSTDADCTDLSSKNGVYVCSRLGFTGAGQCRLASNPSDITCNASSPSPTSSLPTAAATTVTPTKSPTPTPFLTTGVCGQACDVDADCVSNVQTLGSTSAKAYTCYHTGFTGAGECRLASNPTDLTCSQALTVTPTKTPTPTPAISTNICRKACTTDADCANFSTSGGKAGYTCYAFGFTGAGECRLASNPTDLTCSQAVTVTPTKPATPTPSHTPNPTLVASKATATPVPNINLCRKTCTTNADCISSIQTVSTGSQYICYAFGFTGAGECRLASNPTDVTCIAPTSAPANILSPTPTPTPVPSIKDFSLVDTTTDKTMINVLTDGYTFSLAKYPKFSIRVNPNGNPGSIKIVVTGSVNQQKIENGWPFSTGTNVLISPGVADYTAWPVGPGTYTITGTVYSGMNASGTILNDKTITVKVTQ